MPAILAGSAFGVLNGTAGMPSERPRRALSMTIERHETMTDEPVELDERRGMAAQKATEIRRERLSTFQEDQATLRRHQEELEKHLLAAPAKTWPEAAVKAEYLIQLFADTLEAQDPRRKALIAHVMEDLARLNEQEIESS